MIVTEFDGPVWLPTDPPSLVSYLAPTLQPIPLLPAVGIVLALLYVSGVVRLARAGRRWSYGPTASFLAGCALLVVVTGAGIEGYGYEMFSVFMFQQLTLMMAIPPLLVLGRPGTLLLRAVPHGRVGRVVLLSARRALRSMPARVALHPGFTIPLFLLSFYGLYLSDFAAWALASWGGHIALEVTFLVAGVLFTAPVLSTDPLPLAQGHAGRAADMIVEMPLHAFFGVIVMMATRPLIGAFTHPPASWGVDLVADQGVAGGLAWSYGELPSLIVLLIIFARWQRDDAHRAQSADRDIDLHGNAELDAYNAYLESLDRRRPGAQA
ncbi:cytochrome c oxidase assembly protein [Cellulomonas terrae]|uniref:Cytochrome c oxidase assembly protein n=1 Tax=Cellulomonas terrae TaxID=311234 RepID=A0A511JR97_9CELL|nr:cytochrome c oxidase assembly protein [Cellulomonas terrae]GEM00460.1 hypothetical protein CTE05_40060 [Cellulomonas terrae]